VYGRLLGKKVAVASPPANYADVWQRISALTAEKIYNKSVLETKEWKNFSADMGNFATEAVDDAEFAYYFFYRAKDLPFTHYSVQGDKANTTHFQLPRRAGHQPDIKPSLTIQSEHVAILTIPAFDFRQATMDTLMSDVLKAKPANLIIDLRQNPGGDMEGGMRLCQYLISRKLYGGIMLSQLYWNTHTSPPDVSAYAAFKPMNTANYAWFKQQVATGVEGLCLIAEPLPTTYTGKVFILTSEQTASAAEPVVYALQKEGLATVVGSKTAGAVISMEYFTVGNLSVTIPMLDYYTADGNRLDKVGVKPDIVCAPKDALTVVLNRLGK
jgi:C-terminal processing protease CtpA/Prc